MSEEYDIPEGFYYTKEHEGEIQIWRGVPEGGGYRIEQVTHGPARHQTPVISKNPAAQTTRMVAIRGEWEGGTTTWFDIEESGTQHDVLVGTKTLVNAPRWVDDSPLFVICHRQGPHRGQVAVCDTSTGEVKTYHNPQGQMASV